MFYCAVPWCTNAIVLVVFIDCHNYASCDGVQIQDGGLAEPGCTAEEKRVSKYVFWCFCSKNKTKYG